MTNEPRDPALAALARATVRVGTGSGVVIRGPSVPLIATAAHLLGDGDPPIVRKGNIFGEAPVVACDPELDVALVTPPRELEDLAVDLAADGRPGDTVWTAGFPRGWNGPDPVLAHGTIAGLGDENWVNLDGTWGNSGGPLCRCVDGKAFIVGLVLRNASDPSEEFQGWKPLLDGAETDFEHEAASANAALDGVRARAGITREDSRFEALVEAFRVLRRALALSGRLQTQGTQIVTDLIEDHFRTGFLRFAPVTHIRKLLGPG